MSRARRILVLLGALAALATGASDGAADAPRPYAVDARVAHIRAALEAVAAAPPEALKQGADYARTLARGACSAGAARLRVECLLVAAHRYCHDLGEVEATRCELYMDVILSNALADDRLIPPDKRYQIVRENVDYRPALAAELRRIQGVLAVDFRLRAGEAKDHLALAVQIDRFCVGGTDETKLSYPSCVSSLVWYLEGPK